jgi:hypothetical protein
MPNANRLQTVYLKRGDPDLMNEASLYAPGELGQVFEANDKTYQIVKCDSGATAAAGAGVVTANDLAFWKDKDGYLVTNDSAQAIGAGTANAFRNQVAGVFRAAVTAGSYCAVLQRGDNIPVNATGGGIGQTAIANSGTDADAAFVAVGTASTYVPLGVAREATGATTAGMCNVDLNIPSIP